MKFKKVPGEDRSLSTCGRYAIWIQERPLHEPAYWAASRVETMYGDGPARTAVWLTASAPRSEAVECCVEDAARRDER